MTLTLVFLFQLLVPVATCVLLTRYLGPVMRALLEELCGTRDRAEFWVRISTILLMATPLLFVLMTSTARLECKADTFDCMVFALRGTFVYTLWGVIAGVGAVALVLYGYVPKPERPAPVKPGVVPKAASPTSTATLSPEAAQALARTSA
ncbi:hypothetical protein LXM60_08495 [Pandoraea sputorum]|uniref:hypothetical protein n=1 Tax=Pandoraea sputorum TaxID=93222 RepID=UPI001E5CB484|nr:hypothetical protein [Pandoraea sputorum]MCE4060240.1 hypothetical protein [Pandoraea sputorum]